MSHPIIGSKYNGPSLDKPCLRRLPIGWVLEEARRAPMVPWWQRSERWAAIIVALLLLMACAQAALQAFT